VQLLAEDAAPDGAWKCFWVCFYKYSAPTALQKGYEGNLQKIANVEAISVILNDTMQSPLGTCWGVNE
jgi:hypothetical protein